MPAGGGCRGRTKRDPRLDEPATIKCEACNGKGKHWFAYDVSTNIETECTKKEWNTLPETELLAKISKGRHMRGEVVDCDACGGTGQIEYEPENNAWR